jgi:N-acetylneuraminate lyase
MTQNHIKGLIAAPFTPMHPDGGLNISIISDYYRFLKSNGVAGAFICGSTGEGVSLTQYEKKQLIQAWAEATRGDDDFKVTVFLGGTCLDDCIELARYTSESKLYAVSFTAPYYFKPANVKSLAESCKKVADAVPELPFYYYHIPVLTGVGFAMVDLLREADGKIPNFAGIKYTHEDFMDYLSCLHFGGGKYDMLWGRDENMLAALSLGAKGAVGSTYNYVAPLYLQLMNAYENGDLKKARQLQQISIDLISLLGKYGGIATGKAYMKLAGLDCGEFRLPVKNMSTDQFEPFRIDAENFNFSKYKSVLP